MLPKYHILLGAIFSILAYYIFQITFFQASLIFLASVLIDTDHYLFGAKRKKTLNLKKLYFWHKNLPKFRKPIMHIFHTIEFHIFIALLIYFWAGFLFILIGMIFHSFIDLIWLCYEKRIYIREFSLIKYLILRKKYPEKYI